MNKCLTKSCIVNMDKEVKPISGYKEMLKDTMSKIKNSNYKNNFILFVHGRGSHPKKTFKKGLISGLEREYNAKVIMLHWHSKSAFWKFPENKARQSGVDLFTVFKETKQFKDNNTNLVNNINFILFTHSMGSIVLDESMRYANKNIKNIFDTLIISASASKGKNHKKWVDKLKISKNNYVLVNNNDPVLSKAGVRLKNRRLGRDLINSSGKKFQLSTNVKYIDITRANLNHRYYLKQDLNNTNYIKKFFKQVLTGKKAQLNRENVYKTRRNGMVYVLKK